LGRYKDREERLRQREIRERDRQTDIERERRYFSNDIHNYLFKKLLSLPINSYLTSLDARHGSLICSVFEFFKGFQLMHAKDNMVA
jgi:hypothetical protein